MKKVKIFVLILTLALIISSLVLVISSAEEVETKPEIVSANIAYEGDYAILLAIDADTVKGGSVSVQVWDENETDKGTFSSDEATVIPALSSTKTFYIIKTPGISQKDMAKEFKYQATDAEGNKGDFEKISVAQYFYQRLFLDGIADATEGKDLLRKNYYIQTLEGGAMLQQIVDNKTEGNLVTDLVFAYVPGYDFGGYSVALLNNKTTTVELPAFGGTAPEGQKFAGYTVTTYAAGDLTKEETVKAAGETITIDAHTVVLPAFEDLFKRGQGEYFTGNTTSTVITSQTWNMEAANLWENRTDWYGSSNRTGTTLNIENIDGDNAICFNRTGTEAKIAIGYYQAVSTTETVDSNAVAVYEQDVLFTGMEADKSNAWKIALKTGYSNAASATIYLGTDANGDIRFNGFADTETGGLRMSQDTWYNFRFELDRSGNWSFYLNGTHIVTQATGSTGSAQNRNEIYFWNEQYPDMNCTLKLDNVFVGTVTKAE